MKYLIAVVLAISAVSVQASVDLARSKNCMACHAVERKLVGPSFKDVAGRYTEKDIPHLVAVIQRGGSGRWGPIPMPANGSIAADEANTLARWVLQQR
jgi:cytochrome c